MRNKYKRLSTIIITLMMITSVLPVTTLAATASSGQDSSGNYDLSSISQPSEDTQENIPSGEIQAQTYVAPVEPNLDNLDVTIEKEDTGNEEGRIRLQVKVSGEIQTSDIPRKYPVEVIVSDSSGQVEVSRLVTLTPATSPQFNDISDDTRTYNGTLVTTLQFVQSGTTTRTINAEAAELEDSDTASTSASFAVIGESDQTRATDTQRVNPSLSYEPANEVSFVDSYRATTGQDDLGYLETSQIPYDDVPPSGNVLVFQNMRQTAGSARLEPGSDSQGFNVHTATRGVSKGTSQTLVITYSEISSPVDVDVLNSRGEVINPERSSKYILSADPSSTPFCKGGGSQQSVCVFPLSDQEVDVVNRQKEVFLSYSLTEDTGAVADINCQSVVTGAVENGTPVCGVIEDDGDGPGDPPGDPEDPDDPDSSDNDTEVGEDPEVPPVPVFGDPEPEQTRNGDGIKGRNTSTAEPFVNPTKTFDTDIDIRSGLYYPGEESPNGKTPRGTLEIFPRDPERIVDSLDDSSASTWYISDNEGVEVSRRQKPRSCTEVFAFRENATSQEYYTIYPYDDNGGVDERQDYKRLTVQCVRYNDEIFTKLTKKQADEDLNGEWVSGTAAETEVEGEARRTIYAVAPDGQNLNAKYEFDIPFGYDQYFLNETEFTSASYLLDGTDTGSSEILPTDGDVVFVEGTLGRLKLSDDPSLNGNYGAAGRADDFSEDNNVKTLGIARDTFPISFKENGDDGPEGWRWDKGYVFVSDNSEPSNTRLDVSNSFEFTGTTNRYVAIINFDEMRGQVNVQVDGRPIETINGEVPGGVSVVEFTSDSEFNMRLLSDTSSRSPSIRSVQVVQTDNVGKLVHSEEVTVPVSTTGDSPKQFLQNKYEPGNFSTLANYGVVYKAQICPVSEECTRQTAKDTARLVINRTNRTNTGFPPENVTDNLPPFASTGGPYYPPTQVVSEYLSKSGSRSETKYLVNPPTGLGWEKQGKATNVSTIQREEIVLQDVTLAENDPSDYVNKARNRLSDAPAGSWSLEETKTVNSDEVTVEATRGSTYDTNPEWERSVTPVRQSGNRSKITRFFDVGTTTGTIYGELNSPGGEELVKEITGSSSNAPYTLESGGYRWYLASPLETQTGEGVVDSVIQNENPENCLNCLRSETLSEAQKRFANTSSSLRTAQGNWSLSPTNTIQDVVLFPEDTKTTYSYVRPASDWYKIEANGTNRDLWFNVEHTKRPIYQWEKLEDSIQYKYQRLAQENVYEYTKTRYDISYQFRTRTDGQEVYEWQRNTRSYSYEYEAEDVVWLNVSGSYDRGSPQSGIKAFKWNFTGDVTLPGDGTGISWPNNDEYLEQTEPAERTCDNMTNGDLDNLERESYTTEENTVIVDYCQDDSTQVYLRAGIFIADTSKKYTPRLTMWDNAGNFNSTEAFIEPNKTKAQAQNNEKDGKPTFKIINKSERVDYRKGEAFFEVKVDSKYNNQFDSTWELVVSPADNIRSTEVCPVGYEQVRVNDTQGISDTTREYQQKTNCFRETNAQSDVPGSPSLSQEFLAQTEKRFLNDKNQITREPAPAGSIRKCSAIGKQRVSTGSGNIVCTDGDSTFTLATSSGGTYNFNEVPEDQYSPCPDGYSERKEYSSETADEDNKFDVEVTETYCELREGNEFTLSSSNVRIEFTSVKAGSYKECPPGYSENSLPNSIECSQDDSSDPGPNSFVLYENEDWQEIPAGAFKRCPDGYTTSIDNIRDGQYACYSGTLDGETQQEIGTGEGNLNVGDTTDLFTIGSVFKTQLKAPEIPPGVAGYAPGAEKVIWSGSSIPDNRAEYSVVTINPRDNGAIQRGNQTFEFKLRRTAPTSSLVSATEEVRFCEARQADELRKTVRGKYECDNFDSDGDTYEDWVGTESFKLPSGVTSGGTYDDATVYIANYNDACPYNPSYPAGSGQYAQQGSQYALGDNQPPWAPDDINGFEPAYDETEAPYKNVTLSDWYAEGRDSGPCSVVESQEINFETGGETITWDEDDWDKADRYIGPVQYTPFSDVNTQFANKGGEALRLGLPLDSSRQRDSLVAYYPFQNKIINKGASAGGTGSPDPMAPENYYINDAATDVDSGAHDGRFWFRDPCISVSPGQVDAQQGYWNSLEILKASHVHSGGDSLQTEGTDCPVPWNGAVLQSDTDRDYFYKPKQRISRNQDPSVDNTESIGDARVLNKLNQGFSPEAGILGGKGYRSNEKNWIELAGPEKGVLQKDSGAFDYSTHPDKSLGNALQDGDKSYTLRFWYQKDSTVKERSIETYTWGDRGTYSLVSAGTAGRPDGSDSLIQYDANNIHIAHILWSGTQKGAGTTGAPAWPVDEETTEYAGSYGAFSFSGGTSVGKSIETPSYKQTYTRQRALLAHPEKTSGPDIDNEWSRVTITRIDGNDANQFDGIDNSAMILYVDGEEAARIEERGARWDELQTSGRYPGTCDRLWLCSRGTSNVNYGDINENSVIAVGASYAFQETQNDEEFEGSSSAQSLNLRESLFPKRNSDESRLRTQGLFDGKIDELQFYKDPLNPEEFKEENNYTSPDNGGASGTVFTNKKTFGSEVTSNDTVKLSVDYEHPGGLESSGAFASYDGTITNLRIYPCKPGIDDCSEVQRTNATIITTDQDILEQEQARLGNDASVFRMKEVANGDSITLPSRGLPNSPTDSFRLQVRMISKDYRATGYLREVRLEKKDKLDFQTCSDVMRAAPGLYNESGVYNLSVGDDDEYGTTYCDMSTYGGGWTRFWWRGNPLGEGDELGALGRNSDVFSSSFVGSEADYTKCSVKAPLCNVPINDKAGTPIAPDENISVLVRARSENTGDIREAIYDLRYPSNGSGATGDLIAKNVRSKMLTGEFDESPPIRSVSDGDDDDDCMTPIIYDDSFNVFGENENQCAANYTHAYNKDGVDTFFLRGGTSEAPKSLELNAKTIKAENLPECVGIEDISWCELYFRSQEVSIDRAVSEAEDDTKRESDRGLVARASVVPNPVRVEEVSTLDGVASSDTDGNVVSYTWFVNGEEVGTSSNIEYNFTSTGSQSVRLEVEDDDENKDNTTVSVLVQAEPTAVADVPERTTVSETVTFDGSASSDPDGTINSYDWYVDGNSVGSGKRISHSFSSTGMKDVRLDVTDDDGYTDSTTQTVEVEEKIEPVGEFRRITVSCDDGTSYPCFNTVPLSNDYDNPVVIPQPLSFTGQESAYVQVRNVQSDSFDVQIQETVEDDRHLTETVGLLVIEEGTYDLNTSSRDYTIQAGTRAIATYDPGTGYRVKYAGTGYRANSESIFSNPTVLTAPQTSQENQAFRPRIEKDTDGFNMYLQEAEALGNHTYEEMGYVVLEETSPPLRLDDETNFSVQQPSKNIDDSFTQLTINAGGSEGSGAFITSIQTRNNVDPVTLRYRNLNSPYNVEVMAQEDRTNDSETSVETPENVGFIFSDKEVVFDGQLKQETLSPDAAISGPSAVQNGGTYTFDASGTTDSDGEIDSYEWYVNGEYQTTEIYSATYEHTFERGLGTNDAKVRVRAIDDSGRDDSAYQFVDVNNAPTAVANVPDKATPGSSVTFDGTNSSDVENEPISSYSWYVDDTFVGNGATFDYTFSNSGEYEVKLVVTDAEGATDTDAETITVERDIDPIAEVKTFSVSADGECGCWDTVNLDNNFDNPVVIARSKSDDGGEPVTLRVNNAQSSSFDIRAEEWSYEDEDEHETLTASALVVEAGKHKLSDGTVIQAMTFSTSNRYEGDVDSFSWPESFSESPVVFSTVMSDNDNEPVTTRHYRSKKSEIQIYLQESSDSSYEKHGSETVGAVGIEQSHGSIEYQRGTGKYSVGNYAAGGTADGGGGTIIFGTSVPSPATIEDMQPDGGIDIPRDAETLRQTRQDKYGVDVFVERDSGNANEERTVAAGAWEFNDVILGYKDE